MKIKNDYYVKKEKVMYLLIYIYMCVCVIVMIISFLLFNLNDGLINKHFLVLKHLNFYNYLLISLITPQMNSRLR